MLFQGRRDWAGKRNTSRAGSLLLGPGEATISPDLNCLAQGDEPEDKLDKLLDWLREVVLSPFSSLFPSQKPTGWLWPCMASSPTQCWEQPLPLLLLQSSLGKTETRAIFCTAQATCKGLTPDCSREPQAPRAGGHTHPMNFSTQRIWPVPPHLMLGGWGRGKGQGCACWQLFHK